MIKAIVTTTVNKPTEALIKFAQMEGWQLVIAGDLKTPHDDYTPFCGISYLRPEWQESYDKPLSDAIGWNCIQRRNFAFLFACKELKADILATCDDDNIPMDGWGKNVVVGQTLECDVYHPKEPAFDPLSITCHRDLWHRGYPMELVKNKPKRSGYADLRTLLKCDVMAELWNGEADVDAICRMTHETGNCKFLKFHSPYASTKPSPFNSQNTFLSREVMPHYFMFPGIGRMDDIAASYHVQAQGFRVMYGNATVVQKRNEHNLVTDLINEIWGMQNNLAIVKEVPTNKNAVLDRLPENAVNAFRLYQKHFE